MIESLFNGDVVATPVNVRALAVTLLLAFVCGQVLAWIYMLTHSGLSYSRTYVNSLVIMPFLVAMVMTVLSNSLVTAFGLMALFAIVRFRNILRDTLDTCFILAAITIGMACGTQRHGTAIVGLILSAFIFLYLSYSAFGTRHRFDLIFNLHWSRPLSDLPVLMRLLERHCRRIDRASQRTDDQGSGTELSYRLLLRDPDRTEELFAEVRALEGTTRVTGLVARDESEL